MLFFPKNNETNNTKKKQNYIWFLGPTRIDLGSTYSHLKLEIRLRSFSKDIWKTI